ncbi:MAG: hypothetical protein IID46_11350 [Planctomycetes bacterium]|nr:hypothetical protein [Planctomycetota bacterium]
MNSMNILKIAQPMNIMGLAQNAEIHFHQQEQVSVFLESNVSGDEKKFGEIATATFFAIRMLSNLSVNETSDKLATFLKAPPEAVHLFASRSATGGFQLIPYPGSQGRKRFLAKLRIDDCMLFDVKAKGFGVFATGVGYYAPMAVIALIRQLSEKRENDPHFLCALGRAAETCGQFHLQRQITLNNQGELAIFVMKAATDVLLDSNSSSLQHDPKRAGHNEMDTTSLLALLDETRNFVTIMTIDTYPNRESQRCVPTFVTVAGFKIHEMSERGEFQTKDGFGMGDLTAFIGHLNMLWMGAFVAATIPIDELVERMASLGYAYHLTDDQIADWHRMARACDGDETSIDRLVAYFDRIVESIATIPGYFVTRSPIWVKLLCDINSAYHEMMRNPDWIADLDSALERGSPRRE